MEITVTQWVVLWMTVAWTQVGPETYINVATFDNKSDAAMYCFDHPKLQAQVVELDTTVTK